MKKQKQRRNEITSCNWPTYHPVTIKLEYNRGKELGVDFNFKKSDTDEWWNECVLKIFGEDYFERTTSKEQ